ncbi:CPBP family intramembrane glutamic endopeptidase [Nocardia sp. 004]|uniref:CPBP family intramembrane glutamic endopeptidase n=1 Tax=Nocardia sp. 004 TaxID=3385978 RepID=UPI0039A1C512
MSGVRVAGTVAAVVFPLAWSAVALPRLDVGVRGRTVATAGFATGYALTLRSTPNWRSARGIRYGLLAASTVVAGYGAALTFPSVQQRAAALHGRSPGVSLLEWVVVHIPIGTVYSEELIFRGTLDPLLDDSFGAGTGALLGAVIFGLWHIAPARAAGDSVLGTVTTTTAGGLVFGALRRGTAGTAAPALLHLAINAGGAIAPHLARRLDGRRLDHAPAPRVSARAGTMRKRKVRQAK